MPSTIEFVLHFDVDVINSDEFPWTNFPGSGGLSWNEVREALRVFAAQPNLVAVKSPLIIRISIRTARARGNSSICSRTCFRCGWKPHPVQR